MFAVHLQSRFEHTNVLQLYAIVQILWIPMDDGLEL